MKKISLHSRVFIIFSLFTIFLVNIFLVVLYFFVQNNISENIKNSIKNEYSTIKTFIDLSSKNSVFSLPQMELQKINNLWFYLYIWKNDLNLQKKYRFWFVENSWEIIFRWDYDWFNIIIWKKLTELNILKQEFLKIIFFLNIFLILGVLVLSYFITKYSLKPLNKLSEFLTNFRKKWKIIENNYWDSEIGILIDSINKFILENKKITDSQITFIQDTSHELKTPLMQIESNIELIEDKINDKKILEKLEQIKSSSKNINSIISNLWFILKWEEIPKKKEKINMEKYFEELIKKYKNSPPLTPPPSGEGNSKKTLPPVRGELEGGIKIIKNYDLVLENNTYYLDRIFGNLIENAINYNEWKIEIKIEINKNSIKIIDNGIGIEKQEQEKIFNRFYRNPNSTFYYSAWNGLGLVIVKKICDMFGWKINLKSEVWIGSEFEVIIN